MVIILSVYNSKVYLPCVNEGNKTSLMCHLLFLSYKATAKAVICSRGQGQETFIFWLKEFYPTQLSGKKGWMEGWMDEYLASRTRWPPPLSNLFNNVREVTLRSEKCWIYPQTANRNNGAVLIVTLQSSTQRAIRGGLIRGVERWTTLWKGHCTLYLEFLIFSTLRLLCERGIKWKKEKYNSYVITDFLDSDIFPNALVK